MLILGLEMTRCFGGFDFILVGTFFLELALVLVLELGLGVFLALEADFLFSRLGADFEVPHEDD